MPRLLISHFQLAVTASAPVSKVSSDDSSGSAAAMQPDEARDAKVKSAIEVSERYQVVVFMP